MYFAEFVVAACCSLLLGGCSPILAEVPVGAVPRQSWLVVRCWLLWGGSLPMLTEGPVRVVPRHSWLGPAVGFCGMVARHSLLRFLWAQFPAKPCWGLLLEILGLSLANPD